MTHAQWFTPLQFPRETTLKYCKNCNQHRPITEFYRNKRATDGHMHICKACSDERSRAWKEENRDTLNATNRERFQNDPIFRAARIDSMERYNAKQLARNQKDSV